MTYSHEEIVTALETIRAICEKHKDDCKNCELYNVAVCTCGLTAFTARNWTLIEDDPKIWRAFT